MDAALAGIETADETVRPTFVDVPTLVRLSLTATANALAMVPAKQRRVAAPSAAVAKIYKAILRHQPDFKLPTVAKVPTMAMDLCSIVFDATGVEPRLAQSSIKAGVRGDVERAIRAYNKQRAAARKTRPPGVR